MKLKKTLALLASYVFSHTAYAGCNFYTNHKSYNLNLNLPKTISIPANTPSGTVIYHAEQILVSPPNSYWCTSSFYDGSADAKGQSSTSGIYRIENTNFAWQLTQSNRKIRQFPDQQFAPGGYGYGSFTFGIDIIQIGPTTESDIPAGTIGFLVADTLRPLTISTTGTKLVTASCQTPGNMLVDLGKPTAGIINYNLHENWTTIGFRLTGCPNGIKRLQLSLIPTPSSPVIYADQGIIGLNSNSTATGVAIQIRHADTRVFDFNKKYSIDNFVPGSDSVWTELRAKFIRQPFAKGVTPGTAHAEIMYLIEYL